uniref:Uncharacterized protein n=1 Tax=Arundo donax TaxID=35708 RepID=A0A0A9EQC7_ARUDO
MHLPTWLACVLYAHHLYDLKHGNEGDQQMTNLYGEYI